eukprot:4926548-Amphidinium_carterae.1
MPVTMAVHVRHHYNKPTTSLLHVDMPACSTMRQVSLQNTTQSAKTAHNSLSKVASMCTDLAAATAPAAVQL